MTHSKLTLISFLLLLLLNPPGYSRDFPACNKKDPGRTEVDNVCPRLEGIHPAGCCPQIFSEPPLSCDYHIVKDRGQAILANSSYSKCVGGSTVRVNCCALKYKACYTNPINKQFKPRLIFRSDTCCFENCPPASYWRNPPNPDPNFTENHELTNAGNVALCVNETLNECSYGSSNNCEPSSACPAPTPAPAPAPAPSSPGPGPGPGKPGPGTGPGPGSPSPAPNPAPKPAPPAPPPRPPLPPDGA